MSDILKKLGEKPPYLAREAAPEPAPPSLAGLDNIDLRVAEPYHPPENELMNSTSSLTFDASSGLVDLTQLSIEKAKEILEMDLNEKDDSFLALLGKQVTLITTVFTTQARVDESRLRARQADSLPKLLEALRQERAKLPGGSPLIEAPPQLPSVH